MKGARSAFTLLVVVGTILSVPTLVGSMRRVKSQAMTALRRGDAVIAADASFNAEPLIQAVLTQTRENARILVLTTVAYEDLPLNLIYYEVYPRLVFLYPDRSVSLGTVPHEWIRLHKIDWFLEIGANGLADFRLTPVPLRGAAGNLGEGSGQDEAARLSEARMGGGSLASVARAALAVFAIGVIGYGAVLALYRRARSLSGAEALGLAFGLGIGVVTSGMFYLSYCGVALTPRRMVFVLTLLVVASASCVARSRRGGFHRSPVSAIRLRFRDCSRGDRLLMLVLCGLFLFVVADALSSPLTSYDSRTNFALKTKQILHHGGIHSEEAYAAELADGHRRYPLLLPLAEALVCQVSGSCTERGMRLLFPAFYLSLLALLYAAVRPLGSRSFALSAVTLFGACPVMIAMPEGSAASGLADFPLAYFVAALAVYLQRYIRLGQWRDLLLASLMAAFASFTKGEGAPLAAVGFLALVGVLAPWRTSLRKMAPVALAGLGVLVALLPWIHYRSALPAHLVGARTEDFLELISSANASEALGRLTLILRSFAGQFLLRVNLWGALWWCAFAALLLRKTSEASRSVGQRFLLTFVGLYLGGIGLVYLITQWDVAALVADTQTRLLEQIAPLVFLWVSREACVTGLLPAAWAAGAETVHSAGMPG